MTEQPADELPTGEGLFPSEAMLNAGPAIADATAAEPAGGETPAKPRADQKTAEPAQNRPAADGTQLAVRMRVWIVRNDSRTGLAVVESGKIHTFRKDAAKATVRMDRTDEEGESTYLDREFYRIYTSERAALLAAAAATREEINRLLEAWSSLTLRAGACPQPKTLTR